MALLLYMRQKVIKMITLCSDECCKCKRVQIILIYTESTLLGR